MHARLFFGSMVTLLLAAMGCAAPTGSGDSDEESATAEGELEVQSKDLWAGLASYTIERYSADPCGSARRLDVDAIAYDSFARQRAGVRNVCFEVWKPGVTDIENADYWRALDVQVHYRYQGSSDWKTAYVPSIDRRGNNRRYAWELAFGLDPVSGLNVADAKAAFDVVSETATSAYIRSDLEFYFTVNGRKLSSSTNANFKVGYFGTVSKPATSPATVLHADVVCGGGALKLGSGPGYLAAVITDQAAIKALDTSGLISAASTNVSGSGANRTMSVLFGSIENTPAGKLPRYVDGYYSPTWRAETRDAGGGSLSLSLKAYDRKAKKLTTVSHLFGSCVKQ